MFSFFKNRTNRLSYFGLAMFLADNCSEYLLFTWSAVPVTFPFLYLMIFIFYQKQSSYSLRTTSAAVHWGRWVRDDPVLLHPLANLCGSSANSSLVSGQSFPYQRSIGTN